MGKIEFTSDPKRTLDCFSGCFSLFFSCSVFDAARIVFAYSAKFKKNIPFLTRKEKEQVTYPNLHCFLPDFSQVIAKSGQEV